MDKYTQHALAKQLLDALAAEVLGHIEQGRMPDAWDGIELRQYIADKAAQMLPFRPMDKGRARAYRNEILVRNI
jgi:hypothetical protein